MILRLPNADKAVVDIVKLKEYCLSISHPRGRHKARVFARALGFTDSDADMLKNAFLAGVVRENAEMGEVDEYGTRYVVDLPLQGRKGKVLVRTTWIVLNGQDVPRLTSCYVL